MIKVNSTFRAAESHLIKAMDFLRPGALPDGLTLHIIGECQMVTHSPVELLPHILHNFLPTNSRDRFIQISNQFYTV